MKKICKRILAVCVAAVILVTLPGVCVLADEFPVEEMIILDMEEDLAEDIMIDNSLSHQCSHKGTKPVGHHHKQTLCAAADTLVCLLIDKQRA